MTKIIWSPKAIKSLDCLVIFLSKKWEYKVVEVLLNEIDATLIRIRKFPFLYPIYSQKKKLRKCVIKKRTLLFYRATSEEIQIMQIVDARQNPKNYKI